LECLLVDFKIAVLKVLKHHSEFTTGRNDRWKRGWTSSHLSMASRRTYDANLKLMVINHAEATTNVRREGSLV
jgi:hypothetical protein